MPVLNLLFSGPEQKKERESGCLKAETGKAGLSESTCGNGNSDLYKALLALISGKTFSTTATPGNFTATIWTQDQLGNGYEATIARGTLTRENQVTAQPTELFNVSPSKLADGMFDLEEETGWIIDKIWSANWVGYVTDAQGVNIASPALSISGATVKLTPPDPVYGCLKIKYELTRDKLTVNNDGAGETKGDPYSTSVTFDVDGCDEQQTLSLPAQRCLAESLGNPFGTEDWLEDFGDKNLGGDDGDVEIEYPLPEEQPQDTVRTYDFCCRKFISASPKSAEPADPEHSYLGILPGLCGDCE